MSPDALRIALAYQSAQRAGFAGLAAALLAELRAELSRKSALDA